MLFKCWPTVFDIGPTLTQHWVNAPCLLGSSARGADYFIHAKKSFKEKKENPGKHKTFA